MNFPALALVGDRLLVHADAVFYREYGPSPEVVNRAIASVLHGADAAAWDHLLNQFSERDAFQGGRVRAP